jgi:hypothetical protein
MNVHGSILPYFGTNNSHNARLASTSSYKKDSKLMLFERCETWL